MEEGMEQIIRGVPSLQRIMEEEEQFSDNTSFTGESSGSLCSSSSNVADDACSSSCSSFESQMEKKDEMENGPLYELSSLIVQLPLRRGLSKFYTGKSQSFTSLSDAGSIDDLAKKETPYSRRMKLCRSYPGGLDKKQRPICPPRKVISKRQPRGSFGTLAPKMSRSHTFQLNTCHAQT